ncbi:hypothetical protein [Spirosoma rigui]|uniref:hypothetical protein n=1 Tax=Spirosoma rigui TaxID=564064 RepID=UPI0009B0553A|nr:hypothetical protein [Spirosoma rigui]
MKKIWLLLGDEETKEKKEYLIAESYADLPEKLSMAVLRLAYTREKSLITRMAVFGLVCDMPRETRALLCEPEYRDSLERLLDQVDWAWSTGIEKFPFPHFRFKGTKYWLPDEQLQRVTTGEFVTAVAYLVAFSQDAGSNTQKGEYLDKFMATICRPQPSLAKRLMRDVVRFNGDEREAFSSYLADKRAVTFSAIDLAIKIAILQWFLTAVRQVETLYNMPAGEAGAAPLHLGSFVRDWELTVHSLAREGNFGNYDAVMERSIHDVLGYLELKKSEQDEVDN